MGGRTLVHRNSPPLTVFELREASLYPSSHPDIPTHSNSRDDGERSARQGTGSRSTGECLHRRLHVTSSSRTPQASEDQVCSECTRVPPVSPCRAAMPLLQRP